MIYHLHRKFATLTETFIPNQINSVAGFQQTMLTIRTLGHHGKIDPVRVHLSEGTE